MPQNLDFVTYFNVAFFSMLGLGMLFGFLRGLKKAMYSFLITLIFYVVFFFTLDLAVNFLWNVDMPFLGGLVGGYVPDLSNITKLSQALPIMLEKFIGTDMTVFMSNDHVMAFLNGLGIFVLKIVYTILYFTVILIIYRFIFFLIRIIFFRTNKKTEKYRSKNRGLGAVFGLLSGAMSLYISLIIFSGLISITQSISELAPPDQGVTQLSYEFPRDNQNNPTFSVIPLSIIGGFTVPTNVTDAVELMNNMVDAYNSNMVVGVANQVTITSTYSGNPEPLNLYLFDDVLSIKINDPSTDVPEQIAFRQEISIYSGVMADVMNSDYLQTSNLSDITGDEIRAVFNQLSDSKLISSVLPIGLEVGAGYLGTNITVPTDDLFAIDWKTELMQIGEVAGTAFDIVNAAGILNPNTDLQTVTLDGTEVVGLFDELGQSQLITLGAYVASAPLLEMAGSTIQSIITIPDDLNWSDEFTAFGAIAGAVLDSGISVGEIESGDPMQIIQTLASVDFTVLLDSKIVTNAMINVLSDNSNLGVDLSMLDIPTDIVWVDQVDASGNITQNGELRNILLAVNALASTAGNIDLTNLGISTIKDLDTTAINKIFDSRILVATITKQVKELDLGPDFPLITPDSVYDSDGYLKKTELQNVVDAVHMAASALACQTGDTACESLGFDIGKVLSLTGTDIDTLLASDILSATVGNLLITMGTDVLTIPSSAKVSIMVDSVATDIVTKTEIKNVFLAVSALGITDINNIQVDASILNNLGLESDPTLLDPAKADLLFGSDIINATLSKYLLDFTSGASALVVVPYFDQDGTAIRIQDATDGIELISQAELTNILEAVLALNISDFNSLDSINMNLLIDNSSKLLDSAILHATISKQIFDLGSGIVTVPYFDEDGGVIRLTVGTGDQATEYITKSELEHALDALGVIGISDINNFSGNIDLSVILSDPANITILLSSATIQATVSTQVLNLVGDGLITVPYLAEDGTTLVRKTVGTGAEATEYIVKAEIQNVFDALDVIGITDVTNFSGSFDLSSILSDPANVDTLLNSSTIQATVSDQVLNLVSDGFIQVPYFAEDGTTEIRKTVGSGAETTEYIVKTEIKHVFDALDVIGITDVTSFSGSFDLASILSDPANVSTLLTSSTIQATVSKQVLDLVSDGLIQVPYIAEDNTTPIRVTVGVLAEGTETEYISSDEISNVFDALNALGISDITTFSGSVDLSLLSDSQVVDTVLASSTIQATISKQIIDLDTSGTIVVPYFEDDDTTAIRFTTGPTGEKTEYILKSEIKNMIDSMNVLGLTDVANFSGTVDLSILAQGTNADTVLASSVIQATVSKQVLDLGTGGTIVVPYMAEDNATPVRITVGVLANDTETNYLSKPELKAMILSLDVLGLADVTTFSGSVDLSILNDSAKVNQLLQSSTIQATISKQMFDLDTSGTIVVPYFADDNTTAIRLTTGPTGEETEYILGSEIKNMIDSMNLLGFTDVSNFSGSVDLSVLAQGTNADTVLASSVIQATISKQVLDLGTGGTITVPYRAEDDSTAIRITVGSLATQTEYVSKPELKSMILSLDVLGLTDVTTFGGSVNLSVLSDQTKKDTVLSSSVIQATISKTILDLDTSGTVVVPYYAEDNTTEIRLDTGPDGFKTEYILKAELSKMFSAMDILGLTDVANFSGNVDLHVLATGNNASDVIASDIIQATVSKQVLDLDSTNVIVVPYLADNDSTNIRLTVGPVGETTDFVTKIELVDTIKALDLLGITDVTTFNGSIDISVFYDPTTRAELLASSTMQATISKQVLDLGTNVITVPDYDVDGVTQVKLTVGTLTETNDYLTKTEINSLFEALEILGITDITTFDGTVSLNKFFASVDVNYDTNQNILLASASMHATITKQITDLGGAILTVPSTDSSGTSIQATVSGTLFLYSSEIKHLINALDILGINDITSFNGTVSLTNLFGSSTNQDTLLASASMHATISKQLNDLGAAVLTVPTTDVLGTAVKLSVSSNDFITKDEIKATIEALDILGINDITTFNGTVSLTNLFGSSTNQDTLLASASMHATITKQLNDLGSSVLTVPTTDVSGTAVKLTVSTNNFITKNEIKATINALDILGISDITSFSGTVSLTSLFGSSTNQDILLASASMHATITKQISDLGSSVLAVPSQDIDANVIDLTISSNHFITKSEIKHLIDAMDILNISDISTFSGTINLGSLSASGDQDTVLASASMHKTITNKLLGLGNSVLIVPMYTSLGETQANAVQKTVDSNDFITKGEIKAIINAFVDMGYSDLSSFGSSIDSSKFFSNPDLYLLSASIHATLSDKLLNGTGGNLTIPNTNINVSPTPTIIRIAQTDVTYVEINETKALLDALSALGLTDFTSISITPANVFAADFDTLLASCSMQATISKTLLDGALDDSAAAGSGKLIVPNYFREAISVGVTTPDWVEKVELKSLLTALQTLGVTDFSGTVDSSVISGLSDTQLDTVLTSGSMQVTIDNMLKGNANINTKIPNLAVEDVFNMTNITTTTEIKAFIKASNIVSAGSDISNVSIDLNSLSGLTPTERSTVEDSMIIRNILTQDIVTDLSGSSDTYYTYADHPENYEVGSVPLFYTKAGLELVLAHYGYV